jgi:hypothetical protein
MVCLSCGGVIPFPNHSCLGAKPQTVLEHGKAEQQRHGWFRNGIS